MIHIKSIGLLFQIDFTDKYVIFELTLHSRYEIILDEQIRIDHDLTFLSFQLHSLNKPCEAQPNLVNISSLQLLHESKFGYDILQLNNDNLLLLRLGSTGS